MTSESLVSLLNSQREFFLSGGTRTWEYRDLQLSQLDRLIREREDDIYAALHADLGKPVQETFVTEIAVLLSEIKRVRKSFRKWMRPSTVSTPLSLWPAKSQLVPEPRGVVLIIAPWNYPLQLALAPLIGAIAAGCCAVVKPSELTPRTSSLIQEMLHNLFDPNYVAVIEGGIRETQSLLALKFDHIFFTGSPSVGKIVAKAAAENLISTTLELGGKNPTIVTAQADLELAAKRIIWGKTLNAGQTCLAPDTVYVEASVKVELLQNMSRQIRLFYGEKPNASRDFGRIVNEKHVARLEALMANGRVVAGGEVDKVENYVAPTLLTEVQANSPLMQEEVFGPLLPVLPYGSLKELLSWLKRNDRPLAAYLFSDSKAEQRYFIEQLSFGGGCINDTVLHFTNPNLPFGGVGNSGLGAYHGKFSFDAFTHYKPIVTKSKFFDLAIRYPPYTDFKFKLLKRFL